jgi:hypothetical protein
MLLFLQQSMQATGAKIDKFFQYATGHPAGTAALRHRSGA